MITAWRRRAMRFALVAVRLLGRVARVLAVRLARADLAICSALAKRGT
jgi:hypothetical protein